MPLGTPWESLQRPPEIRDGASGGSHQLQHRFPRYSMARDSGREGNQPLCVPASSALGSLRVSLYPRLHKGSRRALHPRRPWQGQIPQRASNRVLPRQAIGASGRQGDLGRPAQPTAIAAAFSAHRQARPQRAIACFCNRSSSTAIVSMSSDPADRKSTSSVCLNAITDEEASKPPR